MTTSYNEQDNNPEARGWAEESDEISISDDEIIPQEDNHQIEAPEETKAVYNEPHAASSDIDVDEIGLSNKFKCPNDH